MKAVLLFSERDRIMLEGNIFLQVAFVSALLAVPATTSTCAHTLLATYSWQNLTYPNSNYPSNQGCMWNIHSGIGYIELQTIYIHIQNSFGCFKDYISIGSGRLCGEQPLQYHSAEEGKDVSLRFVSDGVGSDNAFRLKYRTVNFPGAGSPSMYNSTIKYLSATGSYTPVTYRFNQDNISGSFEKSWIIESQGTYHVLVKFGESTINCPNDFIQIFDGITTSGAVLGSLCDNRTKTFQSTGESLRVLFHSQTHAPGSINFKFRAAAVPASSVSTAKLGLLVGGSFGFTISMAFLGFFIFCLYRKRKGEKDLINTPIISDSSAIGGRDNDGYEDVFLHADITDERRDNQFRSGPRGDNSRRHHDARHADRVGLNNSAFEADERNEREDRLRNDGITLHVHATNLKEEPHLPHGNISRPEPQGAGRMDGLEMSRARGRITQADWPGEHGAHGDRGYDRGSYGHARDAHSHGQRNVREKNSSVVDVDLEISDTEPMIRGGKLILRQSSREGDMI